MRQVLIVLAICMALKGFSQKEKKQIFLFQNLTFHCQLDDSSNISLNIYQDKKIELGRQIFKLNGEMDIIKSGVFKGFLNNKSYQRLFSLLKKCDFDNVELESSKGDNLAKKTLIISYNDVYKKFSGSKIPSNGKKLISYICDLGKSIQLPRYKGAIDFDQ
jgi:hypothetical protein